MTLEQEMAIVKKIMAAATVKNEPAGNRVLGGFAQWIAANQKRNAKPDA